MLSPGAFAIIFVIGGLVTVVGIEATDYAKERGSSIKLEDLLPPAPAEGPPLPRLLLRLNGKG